MTTAEKLRQEGRAEGEAKGRAEGRAETVLKLMGLRFGTIPPEAEARVRAASLEELDSFTERVLVAASLAEVLTPQR